MDFYLAMLFSYSFKRSTLPHATDNMHAISKATGWTGGFAFGMITALCFENKKIYAIPRKLVCEGVAPEELFKFLSDKIKDL